MTTKSFITILVLLFPFIAKASDAIERNKFLANNQNKSYIVIADASSYAECYEMAKNEHSQCVAYHENDDVPKRNDEIEKCNQRYDQRIKACELSR